MKTKFMKVLSVLLAMALLATTGIGALADGYIEIEDPGTLVGQLDDKDVIKVNAGKTASVTIVAKTGLKLNAFEGYWGWGEHMTFTGMTSEVLDKSIEGNYWGNEGKLFWVDLTFPTQENTKAGDKLLTATFDTTGMAAGDYRVSFTLEVLGHEIADQNGEPVQVLFDGEYTLEWSVHVHNDTNNDHICDAAKCDEKLSECADEDKNHECDYEGCKTSMGEHKSNAEHACLEGKCDYCQADMPAADHQPNGDDGNCETAITCSVCGTVTTEAKTHADTDKNHVCDNTGCTVYQGTHADGNNDHNCDYCGDKLSECDFDENHIYHDETHHWIQCYCGAKGNVTEHSHHTYSYYENEGDEHWSLCECGRRVPDSTEKHTYGENGQCVCGAEKPAPEGGILYGDADGDGEITAMDAALLDQYITGWDVTLNEKNADVDGDGEITAMDAALLDQYITGWDVTLGPTE